MFKNIFYDHDAYYSHTYPPQDALTVLHSTKAVCDGYAHLTAAINRAAGLQTKLIVGKALGLGLINWDSITKPNHAWNEVFVDGRWLVEDTTWDAGAYYYHVPKQAEKYFDPNPLDFSIDHIKVYESGE